MHHNTLKTTIQNTTVREVHVQTSIILILLCNSQRLLTEVNSRNLRCTYYPAHRSKHVLMKARLPDIPTEYFTSVSGDV